MGRKVTIEVDLLDSGLTDDFVRQEMIEIVLNKEAEMADREAALRIAKYYSDKDQQAELPTLLEDADETN